MSMHVIYLHLKQSGVFLISNCIIDPPIQRLQIHLPDQQIVTFDNNMNIVTLLQNQRICKTMLTEFFTVNKRAAAVANAGE